MEVKELKTYIDKVLGNSIRCLLPSYWWKRLLKLVVDCIESAKKDIEKVGTKLVAVSNKLVAVSNELDTVKDSVSKIEEGMSKDSYGVIVTTGDRYGVHVFADNEEIYIAPNTSRKIDFSTLFKIEEGGGVSSLNFSFANTFHVTDMSYMFYGCKPTSLDLSNFDTFNVTNMSQMFVFCHNLLKLDLSSFKTNKVTDMSGMFEDCHSLRLLDLSSFDTTNVANVDSMFLYCSRIRHLTLGFDFFKTELVSQISFGDLREWEEESFIQSVVEDSYPRSYNGLPTLELLINREVYKYLTDAHKSTLESKGYIVTSVIQDPNNPE